MGSHSGLPVFRSSGLGRGCWRHETNPGFDALKHVQELVACPQLTELIGGKAVARSGEPGSDSCDAIALVGLLSVEKGGENFDEVIHLTAAAAHSGKLRHRHSEDRAIDSWKVIESIDEKPLLVHSMCRRDRVDACCGHDPRLVAASEAVLGGGGRQTPDGDAPNEPVRVLQDSGCVLSPSALAELD
jgi:hypothetical protein